MSSFSTNIFIALRSPGATGTLWLNSKYDNQNYFMNIIKYASTLFLYILDGII